MTDTKGNYVFPLDTYRELTTKEEATIRLAIEKMKSPSFESFISNGYTPVTGGTHGGMSTTREQLEGSVK